MAARSSPHSTHVGELDLIRLIGSRARSAGAVSLGIGDDCALLRARPGEEIAVTTDLSIEGRHFHLNWHSPESIGHRCLARGLSDLAAMGARPLAAFVSLGLPPRLVRRNRDHASWVSRFYDGLLGLAERHRTPLAGGDLAESPLALADIVLVGAVPRGKALLRSDARPGDAIYVTGDLGGAAAGIAKLAELAASRGGALRQIPARWKNALQPHLYPEPRLAQGLRLRQSRLASAAIDLSDGLSTDLTHVCEESHVAAQIDASAIPIALNATLEQALHGGEDYELLFTARPRKKIPRIVAGVLVTRIGRILPERRSRPRVTLVGAHGAEPLEPSGWQHFA